MKFIDPATLQLVTRALDAGAMRHQAIAQNIANANVAGAKTMRVQFEELLGNVRTELVAGRTFHAADVPVPQAVVDNDKPIALDDQVAALSSNSLQYQALLKAMGRHLGILSVAVQEGRR